MVTYNVKQMSFEFSKDPTLMTSMSNGLKVLFPTQSVNGPIKVPNPDQNVEIYEWRLSEGMIIRYLIDGAYKNISVRYPNGWYWTLFEGRDELSIDDSSWVEIEDWYHKWIQQGSLEVSSEIFKVFGSGSKPYEVDMKKYTCSCPNYKYRCSNYTIDRDERLCKHLQYVLDAYPEYSQKSNIKVAESTDADGKTRYPREIFDIYILDIHKVMYQFREIVERYEICGSYRRLSKMISDIDLLIQLKEGVEWHDMLSYFETYMGYKLIENIGKGDKKAAYMVDGFIHVDFKNVLKENWPFATMHFTGSKAENIRMRRKANQLGFSLNEYGLFKLSDESPIVGLETEEAIYKYLEEDFKQPWER